MIRIYPTNYNRKECEAVQDLVNELETMFISVYCPQAQRHDTECEKCDYKTLCKAVTDVSSYAGGLHHEKDNR